MYLYEERKKIIEVCLRLVSDRLTNGTAGNVSIYNTAQKLVALTPTGVSYKTLTPKDISVLDLQGNLLEGKSPSSELEMHLIFYRNRPEITAIIHGHTVYATSIACLRKTLPAIDYMVATTGDKEVRCAPYASYGTTDLAKNAFTTMGSSRAVLLANHGITTVGEDIEIAYNVLTQIEYVSQLYILSASKGTPVILEDQEMASMIQKFKHYG